MSTAFSQTVPIRAIRICKLNVLASTITRQMVRSGTFILISLPSPPPFLSPRFPSSG
ncbi:unnamed protein product [Gongylonema pulchrum]|uniref:Uncharacterized protein n=1 Tax=Gongylonema pulchrum TaxID=637853 RepID=A0A183F0T5_9BILA|nr:unnamed protein product [Gongylonema pulchrum]